MKDFSNTEITSETGMLIQQQISLLPSNGSSGVNNFADRSQNDAVEENSLNSETKNRESDLNKNQSNIKLLEDIRRYS